MSQKIDPNDPSNTSHAHKEMAPRLERIRAVLGGTEEMREAGRELLPQHEKEGNGAYDERLARTTLYNVTAMTLQSWVGQVFDEPVERDEALPEQITALFDDIDGQGNALDVFAREWFKDGVSLAVAPMLVLFPQAEQSAQPRTLKDDQQEGLRPTWNRIAPENVLYAREKKLSSGRTVINHLRVLDFRLEPKGFIDEVIPQILVYTDTDVTVYEEVRVRGKSKWMPRGQPIPHDMGEVPLVVFYAEREELMVGKTIMFDLADLNIQHWQSTSDQISCLTVARFPMLAMTGIADPPEGQQPIVVGPKKTLTSDNDSARFYYVEHGGQALAAGREDLKDLEARMANFGAEFLKKRPGRESASARILDSAEATSPIEDMALRFNDALDAAMYFTAKWLGIPAPKAGSLKVKTKFDKEEDQQEQQDSAGSPPATQPQDDSSES